MVTEFKLSDGKSYFRLETDGRLRLVLKPEERVILSGQWNAREGVLLLFKGKSLFDKRSYTLAVPLEVWEGLAGLVKTLAIKTIDERRFYAVSASDVRMYGYEDNLESRTLHRDPHGQRYLYVDYEYWSEVYSQDEILDFNVDKRANERAQRGNS